MCFVQESVFNDFWVILQFVNVLGFFRRFADFDDPRRDARCVYKEACLCCRHHESAVQCAQEYASIVEMGLILES